MLLDLSRMRGSEEELDRTYEPAAFEPNAAEAGSPDEYVVSSPVRLTLRIHKKGEQFRLVGRVKTVLTLRCNRCLEDFPLPVDSSFDLLYLPASANRGAGEV